MTQPDTSTRYLDSQQILKAHDEHWDKFRWRYRQDEKRLEAEAYRQLVEQLVAEVNAYRATNQKLEHVFKALGINPREHKAWAEKCDD
jgi:hypothetical protein